MSTQSYQNTANETAAPVCRFSPEDCALLKSVGIDPTTDVPDEVVELLRKGVPLFHSEGKRIRTGKRRRKGYPELATAEDSRYLKKYFLPLESLSGHYPVKVTDELRARDNRHALFVGKDSDRLVTGKSEDDLFYLFPSSAAKFFRHIKKTSHKDYDEMCFDLFRESEDGSFDFAICFLEFHEIFHQEALKKNLPANFQSDDIFVVPLHFAEHFCPVCNKRTIFSFDLGGCICHVCGWCELRMEDNMSESTRQLLYSYALTIDPNFMDFDPIEGTGYINPKTRKRERLC